MLSSPGNKIDSVAITVLHHLPGTSEALSCRSWDLSVDLGKHRDTNTAALSCGCLGGTRQGTASLRFLFSHPVPSMHTQDIRSALPARPYEMGGTQGNLTEIVPANPK